MVQRVLIAGGGTMGQHIALSCLRVGMDVTIYDPNPNALQSAPLQQSTIRSVGHELPMSPDEVAAVLAKAHFTQDPSAAGRDAELFIEAVPELVRLKRAVLREFGGYCPPETVFVTNSSSIPPSRLARATGRPKNFAALHFVQSNFVEVMPHARTAPKTLDTLREFCRRLGQMTIVCQREQPGYVLNTLLMPIFYWSVSLAANGVAHYAEVDRAFMKLTSGPNGPFGMLDEVGLDTALTITRSSFRMFFDRQLRRNAAFFQKFVDAGRLGMVTGRGFYEYPNPLYEHPDFLKGELDPRIVEQLDRMVPR